MYVCMYVWSSHYIARVRINRVRLPILFVVSSTGKMFFSLSPFAPENLVSRDGIGSPVPRQPAHLLLRLNMGAYLRISPEFCGGAHFFSSNVNDVVLSFVLQVQPREPCEAGPQYKQLA